MFLGYRIQVENDSDCNNQFSYELSNLIIKAKI